MPGVVSPSIRTLGLVLFLLLSFLLTPFFDEEIRPFNILILSSLVFAVVVVGVNRHRLALCGLLGLPFIGFSLLLTRSGEVWVLTAFYAFASLFFGMVIVFLVWDVFADRRVDANRLLSAIAIYLCIGVVWSMFYGLVNVFSLSAYTVGGEAVSTAEISDLMYFSLVTLTTLGYGDVVPLVDSARALAAVEAVIGQIYLTVLVARLVGLHIASESVGRERDGGRAM